MAYPVRVKTVDVIAMAVIALTALMGLRRGLVVGVLSLGGLVAGAIIGAKLAPSIIGDESTRYHPLVALAGAMLLSAVGQGLAVMLGKRVRTLLIVIPPLKALDTVGGGLLGAATGLALCWAVGAVLLYFPGETKYRAYAQESAVLSTLNEQFPPGELMDALGRIDPLGALVGPAAGVGAPDPSVVASRGIRRAEKSVVRVTGYACGLGITGSGWIAAPGIVVTAAHVVAGVRNPRVDRADGKPSVQGTVVAFDATNDVAIIRVPGLRGRPLQPARLDPDARGAIIGYPLGEARTVTAARVGQTVPIVTRDAYGNFPVTRPVTLIRGSIVEGNSGGPVVSQAGKVLTTVFAERATGLEGGFGVPTELALRALTSAGRPLDTECVSR